MIALRYWLLNHLDTQFSILDKKNNDLLGSRRSGYIDKKTKDILIYKDAFSAICKKHNMDDTNGAKALYKSGYLKLESKGHFPKRKRIGMVQGYYHINYSFMDSDFS